MKMTIISDDLPLVLPPRQLFRTAKTLVLSSTSPLLVCRPPRRSPSSAAAPEPASARWRQGSEDLVHGTGTAQSMQRMPRFPNGPDRSVDDAAVDTGVSWVTPWGGKWGV